MRIELQDVTIRIGNTSIVRSVDLTVPSGAFLAIVGPNGSGKTTLLRGIYRAVPLTTGRICINGHDVSKMSFRQAAHLRAVVPQFQNADVALTVLEIVSTGRHAYSPWWDVRSTDDARIALDALRQAGAEDLAHRKFGSLSGGERQRVLLARALTQQAATLLLDEPTNHLDVRAQLELLDLLAQMSTTRVAVLHDLDHALGYADLLAVLHEGRIVAVGPPAEVLTDELTWEVFGVHSQIMPHSLTGRPHLLTATMSVPAERAR